MKMKGLKTILFVFSAMIAVPSMVTSCDDWTEIEAKDFFSATANTEAYKAQLKNYFNSPHKVMFGWIIRLMLMVNHILLIMIIWILRELWMIG